MGLANNSNSAHRNHDMENSNDELCIANKELAFQHEEKEKRASELSTANIELAYQNVEKEKRAKELVIANIELLFQNKEKAKRAAELILTDRKYAKTLKQQLISIRESEERLNFFINNVSDYAIIFFDQFGVITSWNSGAEHINLYQNQEIIGQHFSIFFTEQDRKNNKPQWLLGMALSKGHAEDEGWRVKKDGSVFWESVTIIAIRKENGTHTGFVKIAHDLSERRKAEDEIKKLNETLEQKVIERTIQLEDANKELEAFSYSVSHDLRAPLRHIGGFIDLLLKNSSIQLDETGRRYLNTISESSHEMGNLIDALLTFSRLNRTDLLHTKINTNKMISRVIKTFDSETAKREIEFKIKSLPETSGDERLLTQVWLNLISNALKYTRNKETAVIEIGGILQANDAIFYIKDNGVGFDMKYVSKLFGVFQRLHKAKDFEGVGIGLANVKRIINRHGGTCWAESKLGQGATFFFSVPNAITQIVNT